MSRHHERIKVGAIVVEDGVHFSVWAPKATRVDVAIRVDSAERDYPLAVKGNGVHSGVVPGIGAGTQYRYRLDGGDAFPDPASRFQPEGVHGPSEVVDPSSFAWTDDTWPGLTMDGLAIYELHIGAYTPEGTYTALIDQLPELKRLGITAIELMRVADFPGVHNWGYDGVALYAPSRAYGRPDDLRRLVDTAHAVGLGVILDVVYNHLGPDGNYLRQFSDDYFTDRHHTPWGDAINYDGPNNQPVRDFIVGNACFWIREYHIDGFRLDAIDMIFDDGPRHILVELAATARGETTRPIVVIAEEAANNVRTFRSQDSGGYGLDGAWADDFHHELRVMLTGAQENYYADYPGSTENLARAIEEGFIYQGDRIKVTGEPTGTQVTDEPANAFVFCIQNHDQVGNRPFGERLNHDIDTGRYAVSSTLLVFAPQTPVIFMGQEFSASTPFLYFTDHSEELGHLITEGRRNEFSGFRAFVDEDLRHSIPDPQALSTFTSSQLKLNERESNAGIYNLYQTLLRLRRDDPVLSNSDRSRTRAHSLGAQAVAVHRWRDGQHRLLIANFGAATSLPLAEWPILRNLPNGRWDVVLWTESRLFGRGGEAVVVPDDTDRRIYIPARTAAIFATTE